MLETMLEDQKHIQELLGEPMGNTTPERIKENILALVVEATEVLNEIPWKPWKEYDDDPVSMHHLKMEVIDCQIFLLNIINEVGMSADEVNRLVKDKQDINIKRYVKHEDDHDA